MRNSCTILLSPLDSIIPLPNIRSSLVLRGFRACRVPDFGLPLPAIRVREKSLCFQRFAKRAICVACFGNFLYPAPPTGNHAQGRTKARTSPIAMLSEASFVLNRRRRGAKLLAQEEANHTIGHGSVGRAQKFQRAETRLQKNALLIRKSLETRAAVVVAHSARANSSERKIVLRDVINDVVDGDAARDGFAEQAIDAAGVVIKIIEGERPRMRVDVSDRIGDVAIRKHRENRAENFFLHDQHGVIHIQQHNGSEDTVGGGYRWIIHGERNGLCAAGDSVAHVTVEAVKMVRIDNVGVVRIAAEFRVKRARDVSGKFHKLVAPRFVYKNIVRREASLASIVELAGHDALDRRAQRIIAMDDRRTLAAQLEGYGR